MRVLTLVILLTLVQAARSAAQVAHVEEPAARPAPPPGAKPPAVERVTSSDELAQIDARLYELKVERSQYGIGGPIAMMGVGYLGALALAEVALVQVLVTSSRGWGHGGHGTRTPGEVRTARVLLGLSAVGLGVGIGGSVWLGQRLRQRSVYKPELRSLKLRRKELLRDLHYSAGVDAAGSPRLSIGGHF